MIYLFFCEPIIYYFCEVQSAGERPHQSKNFDGNIVDQVERVISNPSMKYPPIES